jgi:hypothetical protein
MANSLVNITQYLVFQFLPTSDITQAAARVKEFTIHLSKFGSYVGKDLISSIAIARLCNASTTQQQVYAITYYVSTRILSEIFIFHFTRRRAKSLDIAAIGEHTHERTKDNNQFILRHILISLD